MYCLLFQIIERLRLICKEENVQLEEDAFLSIVEVSGGDMRRAITTLQSCYRLKGGSFKITKEDIMEISGVIPQHFLEEFITVCKSGNYSKLENFVQSMSYEAYSIGQMFDQLNDYIIIHPEITNKQKSVICDKLGECCFRLQNGGSEYLQVMDLGCVTINAFQNK